MYPRLLVTACLAAVVADLHVQEGPAVAPASRPASRPNILFLFTDDHAAHTVGAYGSRVNATPNLDRIAREGAVFRNGFVTNALCAPSRATILTGKYSHLHGVCTNRDRFDGSQPTFPRLLQQAGYQTAVIGKWHLQSDPTGFDHWEVLVGQGPYYNPPLKSAAGTRKIEGYTTEVLTDLGIQWLEQGRDPARPFLLMLQHKAPHRGWAPGPRQLRLYADRTIPEPEDLFDDWAGRASGARTQEMTIAAHLTDEDLHLRPPAGLTPAQLHAWEAAYGPENAAFRTAGLRGMDLVRWKYQRFAKDYLRCVAAVDESVGRVLDWLDHAGLARDTVVVYSSDNGFFVGDHGWYDKRWMYEESLRVPLLVRWPGVVRPGSAVEAMALNLDFAPTFLAIAGVPVPTDMQGASLVPLLRGQEPADWRRSIYYRYYEFPGDHSVPRQHGVRTLRHKLIRYDLLDEWELFDLEKDPGERTSVHADPAHAAVLKELQGEIERLRTQFGDR